MNQVNMFLTSLVSKKGDSFGRDFIEKGGLVLFGGNNKV